MGVFDRKYREPLQAGVDRARGFARPSSASKRATRTRRGSLSATGKILDPRVRAREDLSPPEDAAEQDRELPPRIACEWAAPLIASPTGCVSASPASAAAPSVEHKSKQHVGTDEAAALPQATSTTSATNVWDGFFADPEDSASNDGEAEQDDSQEPSTKDLPL
jgi:hypothetical protein